jgi:hypothetical protein
MPNRSIAESNEKTKADAVQNHVHTVETVSDPDSLGIASGATPDTLSPPGEAMKEAMVTTDTVVISQKELDTVVVACNRGERMGEVLVGAVSVWSVHPSHQPVNTGDREITRETSFSLFPNPVSGEGLLKINFQQLEKGEYGVLLVNNAGQVIHSERAFVEYKNQVLSFGLNKTAAGVYYIHLVNQQSGKSHSEKLIVQ